MISKTKLFERLEKKRSPEIIETMLACKKNEAWLNVGQIISGSRKRMPIVNLDKIDKESKLGDVIVVPGKVLSQGDVTKKIKVVALDFSSNAKEKLAQSKSEMVKLIDEIKKNPEAKGIKILQ